MDTEYTKLIYQSDKVKIVCEDDFYKVVAVEDIHINELLFAEHMVEGTVEMLYFIVAYNKKLSAQLYPRGDGEYVVDQSVGQEKVLSNCFGRDNGEQNLGLYVTKINSSCSPNCIVIFEEINWLKAVPFVIGKVFSVASIKKGEEITISYHVDYGHHSTIAYKCDCGRSKEERAKIFAICHQVHELLQKRSTPDVLSNRSLLMYMRSEDVKQIMFRQYLARIVGVVYVDGDNPVFAAGKLIGECVTDKRKVGLLVEEKYKKFDQLYEKVVLNGLLTQSLT